MRNFTVEELKIELELHSLWLSTRFSTTIKGRRANLSDADLRWADLRRANLSFANLSCANLRRANLSGANLSFADLRCANLSDADLSDANLSDADLSDANLSDADLSDANLSDANLSDANLSDADLRWANLSGANLSGANLRCANYGHTTSFYALQCPEEGAFIGYKKCEKYIIKLQITENAKRSSSTTRKCRCSEVLVLDIQNIDGTSTNLTEYLHRDQYTKDGTLYKIGEITRASLEFDENRWNECSTGIHFFITRDEAVKY